MELAAMEPDSSSEIQAARDAHLKALDAERPPYDPKQEEQRAARLEEQHREWRLEGW